MNQSNQPRQEAMSSAGTNVQPNKDISFTATKRPASVLFRGQMDMHHKIVATHVTRRLSNMGMLDLEGLVSSMIDYEFFPPYGSIKSGKLILNGITKNAKGWVLAFARKEYLVKEMHTEDLIYMLEGIERAMDHGKG